MKKKELINKIRNLVESSDLVTALELLREQLRTDSESLNEVLTHRSNVSQLSKDFRKGLISHEQYSIKRNKISSSILLMIEGIDSKDIIKETGDLLIEKLQYENQKLIDKNAYLINLLNKVQYERQLEGLEILKNLQGYWLEIIFSDEQRQFSIGRFIYNEIKKEYEFNGINYKNSGKEFYEWNTIKMVSDFNKNRLYYLYSVIKFEAMNREDYGLGMVQIKPNNKGVWEIKKGFFTDAHEATTAKSFFVVKLEIVAKFLSFNESLDKEKNHRKLIKKIVENKDGIIQEFT
ncbi:MAG: hypothetical protein AAFV95_23980 [Bacteroidota bacterium]